MDNKEPFKDLIDPLIEETYKFRAVFDKEYDDKAIFKDLRWQTVLEGHFFEQLYDLSRKATAEQIGEYVIEFLNTYDQGAFEKEE